MSENPQFRGLRPNPHTLGVEKLAADEASRPVRIRASHAVHKRLKKMSAKEIGDVLERVLG